MKSIIIMETSVTSNFVIFPNLLKTGTVTAVLRLFSVATIVGLPSDTKPLGLSFASTVTVAVEKSPTLAPPVASDRVTVNPCKRR